METFGDKTVIQGSVFTFVTPSPTVRNILDIPIGKRLCVSTVYIENLPDHLSNIDIAVHVKHLYVGNILTGKIVENKFEGKNFKIKSYYF